MLREKVGEKTEFVGVGGRNGGNREDGNMYNAEERKGCGRLFQTGEA